MYDYRWGLNWWFNLLNSYNPSLQVRTKFTDLNNLQFTKSSQSAIFTSRRQHCPLLPRSRSSRSTTVPLLCNSFTEFKSSRSRSYFTTDGQSVYLGVGHPFFYLFPLFFRKIALLFVLGRPLWREDDSVICSAICQWSDYCLIWDYWVPFPSPLTTRRNYGGSILTCLDTGTSDSGLNTLCKDRAENNFSFSRHVAIAWPTQRTLLFC
jgi:hypothetical protein